MLVQSLHYNILSSVKIQHIHNIFYYIQKFNNIMFQAYKNESFQYCHFKYLNNLRHKINRTLKMFHNASNSKEIIHNDIVCSSL